MGKLTGLDKWYNDYLRSDRWKCSESPTGAHHWVEHHSDGIFICKWCFDVKRFPRTFQGALEQTYGHGKFPMSIEKVTTGFARYAQQVPLRRHRRGKDD